MVSISFLLYLSYSFWIANSGIFVPLAQYILIWSIWFNNAIAVWIDVLVIFFFTSSCCILHLIEPPLAVVFRHLCIRIQRLFSIYGHHKRKD